MYEPDKANPGKAWLFLQIMKMASKLKITIYASNNLTAVALLASQVLRVIAMLTSLHFRGN